MVQTFQKVVSGDYVPNSTGVTLGIAALPGSTPATVIPMRVNVATLGNFGSGNPVCTLQVQRIQGGTWYPVAGGTITNNGTLQKTVVGVAVRVSVPTLTAPGTTTTAPRVAFHVENLTLPRHGQLEQAATSNHYYSNAVAATNATVGSVSGFGRQNPDVPGLGTPSKTLIFVTMDVTSGAGFIESTFRDGEGSFLVPEGTALAASGQTVYESLADEFHFNYTKITGTATIWVDAFKILL